MRKNGLLWWTVPDWLILKLKQKGLPYLFEMRIFLSSLRVLFHYIFVSFYNLVKKHMCLGLLVWLVYATYKEFGFSCIFLMYNAMFCACLSGWLHFILTKQYTRIWQPMFSILSGQCNSVRPHNQKFADLDAALCSVLSCFSNISYQLISHRSRI